MDIISARRAVFAASLFLVVAWGALAFGAVYPWAYRPLAMVAGVTGTVILLVERRRRPPLGLPAGGLIAIAAAILLQLAPVSRAVLAEISPNAQPVVREYDRFYGVLTSVDTPSTPTAEATGSRPISIAPGQTQTGLFLFVTISLFCVGTARLLSVSGAQTIARPLAVFGAVLAVIGIAQFTLTLSVNQPLIYGFWKPQFMSRPFGPFVNPNHFAGWMLMALPLALALFYDSLQRMLEEMAARRENRIALVGTPLFSRTVLFAFVSVLMGLSLIMTRSRSGIAALAAASVLIGWIVIKRQKSSRAKAVVAVCLLAVMAATAAWAGLDTVVGKFIDSSDGQGLGATSGRLVAWSDTVRIIRDFPLTGTGFNSYGTAMAVYQSGVRELHFQEAHNDYLQLAAEGGLLVGIPIMATIALFSVSVRRRFREAPKVGSSYWLRVGAVIGLLAIALQSAFDFSLQMPGNAALFAVVAAIALHQSPNLKIIGRS